MRTGPFKPEYFLRPGQLARRILRALRPPPPRWQVLDLPFGLSIEADVEDTIGRAVWHLGIYELVVSELLFRLAEPGDAVADVGAHIGHMSAVLAARVGASGRVLSFEPNTALREVLQRNAERWRTVAPVEVRREAVSSSVGTTRFAVPDGPNSGLGRIAAEGVEVPTTTLDAAFGDRAPALLKLDVEGAELAVLEGAQRVLPSVRDVVFEDHLPQPSPVTRALERSGFEVKRVRRGFLRPALTALTTTTSAWEPPVFVATRDAARLHARLRERGWKVLRRYAAR